MKTYSALAACVLVATSFAIASTSVDAQALAARVSSAAAPRVQFEFPGKTGVCGDGQTFLSSGRGSSYYGQVDVINGVATQACAAGPIRVVIDRSEGVITNIETVAGPPHAAEGATDIGTVSARDAADFFMSIASTTDGRASRQAILPAALADGVDVSPTLMTIARDQNRSLDTRRGALSWLARDDNGESGAHIAQATNLLLHIARDENETQALRRSSLNQLGRIGHGAGIPSLIQLANDNTTSWIAEESVRALAQSGDPRAREFLRKEVRRTDLPDAMLTAVVRGLGGSDATGSDVELLRSAFPIMSGERSRAAVMESAAQRGTSADTQWLLGLARDVNQPTDIRRRAIDLAARSTTGGSQTLALYDRMDDPTLKEALIRVYGQNDDRASLDKLISIAKTDSNYTLRKRAISSLSRTQDARARQALTEISTH